MSFTARYNSYCPECDDEIIADLDEIVMVEFVGAVHEGCAPKSDELTFTFPIGD